MPVDPLAAATAHAELGLPVSTSALPKRLVERLTRFLLEPQRAYNRGVIDAIRLLRADNQVLAQRVIDQGYEVERLTAALRADLDRVEVDLVDDRTGAALTGVQLGELAEVVHRLEARIARLDGDRPVD
jgi:broad-specificity NMP kinase